MLLNNSCVRYSEASPRWVPAVFDTIPTSSHVQENVNPTTNSSNVDVDVSFDTNFDKLDYIELMQTSKSQSARAVKKINTIGKYQPFMTSL